MRACGGEQEVKFFESQTTEKIGLRKVFEESIES